MQQHVATPVLFWAMKRPRDSIGLPRHPFAWPWHGDAEILPEYMHFSALIPCLCNSNRCSMCILLGTRGHARAPSGRVRMRRLHSHMFSSDERGSEMSCDRSSGRAVLPRPALVPLRRACEWYMSYTLPQLAFPMRSAARAAQPGARPQPRWGRPRRRRGGG